MNLDAEQIVERLSRTGGDGFSRGLNDALKKRALEYAQTAGCQRKPILSRLGSALTHPMITTDYSEALLEFVTKAHDQTQNVIDELSNIHRFVYRNLRRRTPMGDVDALYPGG